MIEVERWYDGRWHDPVDEYIERLNAIEDAKEQQVGGGQDSD